MEVRIYDPELKLLAIIEDYTSLLWNRKYSAAGDFELHAPATPYNVSKLARGNIVAYQGALEGGVIEDIEIEQTNSTNAIIVKGRFLESYLDRRLIYTADHVYNFSGLTEAAMRSIIANAVPIPLLQLGEIQGYEERVSFQVTYQSVLKYESKLADSMGAGFRITPDFVNKVLTFNVYKGLDHSAHQSQRVRVTFSDEYKNINGATYSENDQLLKTVCYVGGQGEGAERVWVVAGDNSLTGLERREVKLDAGDVDPTDLTEAQYKEKLRQRGESLLAQSILAQSFECNTVPEGNFSYKRHWDLGDIITLEKKSWGLSIDLRVTGITEAYEHGRATITPTFGNPIPDAINFEDE